jgi:hypothetical protein
MTETDTTRLYDTENGNICIECGLCCDGSMFKHAKIDKNDDMAFLKQVGVEFIAVSDKQFFHLPCMGQDGKLCRLYNDARRFKVCKEFKCRLLKQYISGEISYNCAMDTIREILIRRQSVKEFFEILHTDHNNSDQSIFSFIRELNLSGKIENLSFRKTYSKQILDCFIFRELLNRKFYKKNSKETECHYR